MRLLLTLLIATTWAVNGLYAKVLGAVPRHEAIVARVVGVSAAEWLVVLIGLGELGLACWLLWGRWPRWTAYAQILAVLTMNTLEAWLAPDLLLWGWGNAVFATLFCVLVYVHGVSLGGRRGGAVLD